MAPVVIAEAPNLTPLTGAAPLLELHGIHKGFPGVVALRDARLRLFAGEVHVLMGQNGAGKSTLIKVMTGVYPPDAGTLTLGGRPLAPRSPQEAQALGLSTVYQEVNLCPNLSITENILAGRLPRRWGWIHWAAAHVEAERVLATVQLKLDVRRALGELPIAVQQMVAIARAVSTDARVLILDEPTSSLDEAECTRLFAVMRGLQARGVAILFITHFLAQAYEVADRFTVMRNGEFVGEYLPAELPRLRLVSLMIGRDFSAAEASGGAAQAAFEGAETPVLQAQGLGRRGQLQPVDLQVRAGEVLGLAGLLGSGRTETARLLFGVDRSDTGRLMVCDQALHLRSPGDAVRAGMAYCPEERKTEAIVAELSVRENIALALQAKRGTFRFLRRREQNALAEDYVRTLGIRTANVETPIGQLSGGNQQKAILARWLATDPRLLILDEPTRGIDVAAKQEIMSQVLALCQRGLALVFISSEIPEVLRASHRIAVLSDRRKVTELPAQGLSEAAIFRIIADPHDAPSPASESA